MTVVTAKQLGDHVGAQVLGVDRERLLADEQFPAWCLETLEANGALVFRDLHLDDATQVAFSKKSGGETEFASTYTAYDALTPDEQEEYLQVRVVHSLEAAQRLVHPDPSPEELAIWRKRPSKTHPLVWQHQTGRRSLVLGATASHVEGMEFDEGRAFLDDLLARSTGADRVYRHEWAVGDVVIWDNRGVLHRACRYDPSSARDMHRTTIAGDEPIQ
jgi:alpha-ketoglutarate-dependent taurine dioxygenase